MEGFLRVIPNDGSDKPHRVLLMRQAPVPSLIESIIGGKLERIEGFDSILHMGSQVRCLAFRAREETDYGDNTFANMLWLQALLRETGFIRANGQPPRTLIGPIVILHGDDEFLNALIWSLLDIPLAG